MVGSGRESSDAETRLAPMSSFSVVAVLHPVSLLVLQSPF